MEPNLVPSDNQVKESSIVNAKRVYSVEKPSFSLYIDLLGQFLLGVPDFGESRKNLCCYVVCVSCVFGFDLWGTTLKGVKIIRQRLQGGGDIWRSFTSNLVLLMLAVKMKLIKSVFS